MTTRLVSLTESDWAARDDARTLAHAEEIKADEKRLTAAKQQAGAMLEEEQKELTALRKVAGKGRSPATVDVTNENKASKPASGSSLSPKGQFKGFKRII